MSHKALITFPDEQYARLREVSQEVGAPVTELVRRAVSNQYGKKPLADDQQALADIESVFGIWADREEDLFEKIRGQWPVPKEW